MHVGVCVHVGGGCQGVGTCALGRGVGVELSRLPHGVRLHLGVVLLWEHAEGRRSSRWASARGVGEGEMGASRGSL